MKVCKQCGQAVQDVETYCPRCGSGQLIPDTAQRNQQRTQQRVNPEQMGAAAPSQSRQPQQAPPGYRNPNSVPQQRPIQRPPQQGVMNQRPPQRVPQPGQTQQRPVQPPYQQQRQSQQPQQMQMDDYGFGAEQPVVKEKKRFGLGKKSKEQQAPIQQPQQVQQNQAPNQAYGMPYNTQPENIGYNSFSDETVTIKEWFIMLLKLLIPIYNIIFIIGAWKGKNVKPSMQNYIKVYVIMLAIGMVLGILFSVVITPLITSLMW